MAVVLSLIGSVWFINKAEEEKRRNRREMMTFSLRKRYKMITRDFNTLVC